MNAKRHRQRIALETANRAELTAQIAAHKAQLATLIAQAQARIAAMPDDGNGDWGVAGDLGHMVALLTQVAVPAVADAAGQREALLRDLDAAYWTAARK